MVSLLFLSVATVVITSGIFTAKNNYRVPANRVFFILTAAIAIWSTGMALSIISNDVAISETYRRISAIGWSTAYAILLHFILVITGKSLSFRKWWLYLCLYLPAVFTLFAFAVPNSINPFPYDLHQTKYGWINVANNNVWDWIFYAYYISFTLIGLFLLYRWGKKSSDAIVKKKSHIMILSILLALVIGTITDVILSSLLSGLPQMAPVIMLIPVLSTYHILQKDSFTIAEGIDKKTSYIVLFISVLLYIILSSMQVFLSDNSFAVILTVIDESAVRGIVIQIQLFISIYLVLKENKPGYILAVIMNFINLLFAIIFSIRNMSTASLPGIVSCVGALLIITLIKDYKEKNAAYIKKINTQAVREKFYSNVFKQAPVGIAIISGTEYTKNQEFDDLNINPSYMRILGRTKDELQKIDWTQITHPGDLATDLEYFDRFKEGKIDSYSRVKRYIKPDGSAVWVDMLISRFEGLGKKPGDHVCIITDVTERRNIEATLKYNSEHVLLTGLYNRSVLEKTLASDDSLSSTNKRALVCVNLFAMHELSMRYGYYFNQTLLKKIADELKALCDDECMLFDTTEYRFVYYLKYYEDEESLKVFCEKVSKILSSFLYVHGIKHAIGILQIDKVRVNTADELLKKVMDTSETVVNNNYGYNKILFYDEKLDIKINRDKELSKEIKEIAEGIKPERLHMQFQPIYDLKKNRISGFEALARLNSEKYGLISPLEFITIAEKTNMIASFGESIITQALSFLHKLKENGHDTIVVSINISTIQMLEDGFTNWLLSMINEMNVNPENVGIELTESVFAVKRLEISSVIDKLKDTGIKILIDDFGTGYSSFARVSEFNVDFLKIDKSFIDRITVLEQKETIIGDIISMSHKMGQYVVAEGVEHEEQLDYLRSHDCDRIQGYLIGKPMDEEEAIEFLNKHLNK